jgi:hypothetical protein
MSHEYKKAAKESHDKKLKSYGEGASGKAKNFAGFDALNTNEQRGEKVIDKEPELSKETASRIMRKAGGAVKGAESLKRLDKAPRKGKALGGARPGPVPTQQEQEQRFSKGGASTTKHMPEVARREKGGKVGHMEWEHSKKDLNEDKKLAKKHGMSMEKWEESDLDKKHDKQQSMEGLKKGGAARKHREDGGRRMPSPEEAIESEKRLKGLRVEPNTGSGVSAQDRRSLDKAIRDNITPGEYKRGNLGGGEYAMKKGGSIEKRAKRASGGGAFDDYTGGDDDRGSHKSGGKKAAGKTTINVIIGQQPGGAPAMGGAAPAMMAPPAPMAPPPMPPAAPPMMAPPPGGPPPMGAGPMGPGGPGGLPMMRKDGGKVQVPYKKPGRKDGYPAMDFGAGNGFGRKQKIDAYGDK